jgi:hypothetical protein
MERTNNAHKFKANASLMRVVGACVRVFGMVDYRHDN